MEGRSVLTPPGVVGLVDVFDPRISPAGDRVAFVTARLDPIADTRSTQVCIAGLDGSLPAEPIDPDRDGQHSPRWSPDGRTLAVVGRGETGGSRLCLYDGDLFRTVADFEEEIEDLCWSPDGCRIAVLVRIPLPATPGRARRITHLVFRADTVGWLAGRPRHVVVVDLEATDGPRTRQLTDGPVDVSGLTWSPDGREIGVVWSREENWDREPVRELFAVPADGGRPRQVTNADAAFADPVWVGDSIVAVCDPDPAHPPRQERIVVVQADGKQIRDLTHALPLKAASPFLARGLAVDRPLAYFPVEDRGDVHLYRAPLDASSAPEPAVGGTRVVHAFDANAGRVVFVASAPDQPADLYVATPEGERRLTSYGADFAARHVLATPTAFRAEGPGGAVDAWLLTPPGHGVSEHRGQPLPTLLHIHGGPHTQHGSRFLPDLQILAAAGFAVLYANPRGSTGRSEEWARAIRGPRATDPGGGHGPPAYEDLMAVVDEAVRRFPVVDGERLGVYGGSYGGFMTAWMIAHTDRFKAACAERAALDLHALCWRGDGVFAGFADTFGVSHLDDPDELRRQSPISHADTIHTPLLLLHNDDDRLCPVDQAEQMFLALRLLGRDVEFVRFPDASHMSISPAQDMERRGILIEWFHRHLVGGPIGGPGAA